MRTGPARYGGRHPGPRADQWCNAAARHVEGVLDFDANDGLEGCCGRHARSCACILLEAFSEWRLGSSYPTGGEGSDRLAARRWPTGLERTGRNGLAAASHAYRPRRRLVIRVKWWPGRTANAKLKADTRRARKRICPATAQAKLARTSDLRLVETEPPGQRGPVEATEVAKCSAFATAAMAHQRRTTTAKEVQARSRPPCGIEAVDDSLPAPRVQTAA